MLLFQEKRSLQDDLVVVDVGEHTTKLGFCRGKGSAALLEDLQTYEYQKVRMEERIQEVVDRVASFHARNIAFTFTPSVLKTRVLTHSIRRVYAQNVIDEREAGELKKSILREGEEKGKELIASQTGILPEEFVCVRSAVLGMRIDGYDVENLRGFLGETVEFRLSLTFLQERVRASLAKSLLSSTMKLQGIDGEASCLEKICKDVFLPDAIFVDVGEMGTRFFLFSHGKILSSGEFKKGGERYTKIVEQSLRMSHQNAVELKRRHGAMQGAPEEMQKKLKELFAPEFRIWKQELLQRLGTSIIPRKVFFFGGGSMLSGFSELFPGGSLLLPKHIIPSSSSSPEFTSLALCALATILRHE
ncbi:MAG: hypothetical protein Q7S63_01225 [bacterium]|nr:hypothetical protein [bacterium]